MVFRQIAGEAILVPICTRVEEADSIYTLNEVAARIWELVDGSRNVGQILVQCDARQCHEKDIFSTAGTA
jgi:hypothetical protein